MKKDRSYSSDLNGEQGVGGPQVSGMAEYGPRRYVKIVAKIHASASI